MTDGTWTLRIDPERSSPPIVVRDVVVGSGNTHVEPRLERGRAIRVRVIHDPGSEPPRIDGQAIRRDEPALQRITHNDNGDVTLFGLDEGCIEVKVGASGSLQTLVERAIDIDGVTNVDLAVDARASSDS